MGFPTDISSDIETGNNLVEAIEEEIHQITQLDEKGSKRDDVGQFRGVVVWVGGAAAMHILETAVKNLEELVAGHIRALEMRPVSINWHWRRARQ